MIVVLAAHRAQWGVPEIHVLSVIASRRGLAELLKAHPDVHVTLGKIDDAEIQHKVCALLMLLSMEYKQNVARNGGCKAILDAMRIHVEEGALQVTAMDALEVLLSCDGVGASTLLSRAGMSIVADVMRAHENNPEIRTRGRAILGNLVLDGESRTAAPVSET